MDPLSQLKNTAILPVLIALTLASFALSPQAWAVCQEGEGHVLSSAELDSPPDGTGACVPPLAGLVSWWSGDRTTDDMQGINPGELVGGASYKRGMVGPGFFFHGGFNEYVQVGDTPTLMMTTAMTLECWIYPTIPQLNGIIANREGEYEFARNPDPDGDIWWAFANTDPGWVGISTGFVAPLASWTHIAITYDNGLITTYGNGVQVHQFQGSGAIGDVAPTLNDFRIGNRQDFPWPFAGIIDELKIYNRVLSSSEVAAIYAAGSNGNCKPNIFVASIDPSYEVVGRGFLISTSILIQDENGIGIENASVQIKTILPNGSVLDFPVTTDATGEALVSFAAGDTGLYRFTVRKVSHPFREYDRSLNVETTDTLVIP
jgi:Concanavalin A-like lectin/glucanases superfamily